MKRRRLDEDARSRRNRNNDEDSSAQWMPPPPDDDNISLLSFSQTHPEDDIGEGYPSDLEDQWEDDVSEENVLSFVAAAPPRIQALIPTPSDGGLPALGTRHPMPLERSLCQLPVLDDEELALLELHRILSKRGRTRRCFDYVVEWLERQMSAGTFNDSGKLPRLQALMSGLTSKFPSPPYRMETVTLETGTENIEHPDDYERGKEVQVPVWDFQEVLTHYLLDPTLFGNKDNLVNPDDPFSKFVIADPKQSKEYLASRHYSDTYDMLVDDPATDLPLPIEIYIDKTGKTSGITSACGEPMLISTPLLKKSVREQADAWEVIVFIPDLEKGSSAKKRQEAQRELEKGRGYRNYHRCLAKGMESLQRVMDEGGFNAWVIVGNEMRYVRVIPFVTVLIGDGKNGDTLVLRFGGKNCLGRVSRLCMTPFGSLSDPTRMCPLIKASMLKSLYDKSVDQSLTLRQRKAFRNALKDTSTHWGDDALFRLHYGANPFGATLATAVDMMHANESGIIKTFLKVFVGSMPLSVQVQVDTLVEKLFVGDRQSARSLFSRMNFSGGACSLTMLSSHHWPGMAMAFLMVLLTPEGKLACEKCFQENDAPEPDYDWEAVPSLDQNHIYCHPILHEDEETMTEVAAPLDRRTNPGEHDSDSEAEPEETRRDIGEHESDSEAAEEDLDSEGTKKKKKKVKAAIPLKCSYRQFIELLQEVLTFHAFYRYGDPPFNHNPSQDEIDDLQLSIRKMVARLISFCPRNTGYGWELQKLHDHFHIILDLLYFHHCSVWDAGTGERLLKTFFKELAATCQERSLNEFMTQMANRAQERRVLQKALRSLDEKADYEAIVRSRHQAVQLATRPEEHCFPVDSLYTLWYSNGCNQCSFQWNGKNKSVQVHPLIRHWFASNWNQDNLGMNAPLCMLECYTEYCHKGPGFERVFRAHPCYGKEGPWYDWAKVSFGQYGDYPTRLLVFYRKHEPVTDSEGNVTSSGIYALVHSCDYSIGTRRERMDRLEETHLCKRWKLESQRSPRDATVHVPKLRSISVECLQEHVYIVNDDHRLSESWRGPKYIWEWYDQRTVWPKKFPLEKQSLD